MSILQTVSFALDDVQDKEMRGLIHKSFRLPCGRESRWSGLVASGESLGGEVGLLLAVQFVRNIHHRPHRSPRSSAYRLALKAFSDHRTPGWVYEQVWDEDVLPFHPYDGSMFCELLKRVPLEKLIDGLKPQKRPPVGIGSERYLKLVLGEVEQRYPQLRGLPLDLLVESLKAVQNSRGRTVHP